MSEAAAKHAGGRPSTYNAETASLICASLAEGKPLVRIVEEIGVPIQTVYSWMNAHPEFSEAYARAREDQADTLADEIIKISDDASNDSCEDEDGKIVTNHENIQRSKLRVDTRKWVASKLRPKKYGDKQQLEHSGPDGKPLNLAVLEPDAVVDQLVSIATEYPQAAPRLRKLLQTALDRMPA